MSDPIFTNISSRPFGLGNVNGNANPTLVDIDGDDDLDAFVGDSGGRTSFFQNTGTANSPVFAVGINNPFGLSNVSGTASPALVDIDGDGDQDAFIGDGAGNTRFFLIQAQSAIRYLPFPVLIHLD